MCARIRLIFALGSLLATLLFSSALASPALARSADAPISREERCQAATETLDQLLGIHLDQETCLKNLKKVVNTDRN